MRKTLISISSHGFILKQWVIGNNYVCQTSICLILSTRNGSFLESRCFVSLSSTIPRVPSFIVRDSSETAVGHKKTKRESAVPRRKDGGHARDGEKEQKERAAGATSRKALFRRGHDGEEGFFLLGKDPCMDLTTTYETTPASSSSPTKSNTKVSLSWEAWNAELFPVYLDEFPTSFRWQWGPRLRGRFRRGGTMKPEEAKEGQKSSLEFRG